MYRGGRSFLVKSQMPWCIQQVDTITRKTWRLKGILITVAWFAVWVEVRFLYCCPSPGSAHALTCVDDPFEWGFELDPTMVGDTENESSAPKLSL